MLLSISIVTFHSDHVISSALDSIIASLPSELGYEVLVVDHSSDSKTEEIVRSRYPNVFLRRFPNDGFGAGHNKALASAKGKYFLIHNPDVVMGKGVVEELTGYLEKNVRCAAVMPLVRNEDGTIQYLCKREPTVLVLLARRIRALGRIFRKELDRFLMKDLDFKTPVSVPIVSGAFLLARTASLRKVGGFDEGFFLYFEDFDLCRRLRAGDEDVVFYPEVSVVHKWERGSSKNPKLFWYLLKSMVRYFNKWGWRFA